MKKQTLFLSAAGLGGIAGFFLRLWQNQTGFEPETGLPIPGSPAGILLVALLAAMAAVLFLLSRTLPQNSENPPAFPADFSTENAALLMLPVTGIFLIAFSGILDILVGLNILSSVSAELPGLGTVFLVVAPKLSTALHLVLGVLSLASAGALMLSLVACRHSGKRAAPFDGTYLLLPVISMVAHLVLTYRADTLNPSAQVYYVELLTLTFLVLSFSRLSSFAFEAGRTRAFALCVGFSTVLTLTLLSDSNVFLSSLLLYLGSSAVLLGFLILLLGEPSAPVPEEAEDA